MKQEYEEHNLSNFQKAVPALQVLELLRDDVIY